VQPCRVYTCLACAGVQAAKDAQKAKDGEDPAAWRKSFVRAMNHLANCSARPAGTGAGAGVCAAAGSDAGVSIAASHVTEGTLASEARPAHEQRRAREEQALEPDWDKTTKVGDDTAQHAKLLEGQIAQELIRENPALAWVHSAQSVKAVVAKREEALRAQACA
jgi:hypothetical protein